MSFWPPSWTSIDRKILDMALPNIVSNMSTPLIGLVDTFVAGHLGSTEELAGIAVGVSAFYLLYNVFVFLRKGTTGLTAQACAVAGGAGLGAQVLGQFFPHALRFGFAITALQVWHDALERMLALDDIATVVEIAKGDRLGAGARQHQFPMFFGQLAKGLVQRLAGRVAEQNPPRSLVRVCANTATWSKSN